MRVAVTGSEGMLGHELRRVFYDTEITNFTLSTLDVTSLDDVMRKVREVRPEYLIHAAAFTDVDRCESEPETAYLVNGLGARNVAMACEEVRCPMVYISTDYVFDGTGQGAYNEWDQTAPVNQYGLSKLMGERFVQACTNRFYIVRTSWLYGVNGKNFVDTVLRLLRERDSLDVVNDQRGCPTYSVDLARTLKDLMGRGYGTYHVTNSGECTWYDFAVEIARQSGINRKITPVTSEQFRRPAKRPANSVLGKTMLRLEGIAEPRRWEEGLAAFLKERGV